ncbi:hypothetical protein KEM54_001528 [Ascosphaera aggregata]|nr:hypothetical protein KEM54_001528 [Ascosphaera aggregata]
MENSFKQPNLQPARDLLEQFTGENTETSIFLERLEDLDFDDLILLITLVSSCLRGVLPNEKLQALKNVRHLVASGCLDMEYILPTLRALRNGDNESVLQAVDDAIRQAAWASTISRESTPEASSAASDAFSTPEKCLTGKKPVSATLSAELIKCFHQYKTGKGTRQHFASPYTSIVGPSGIGKSFTVVNMAKANLHYVFYVSLASSTARAVPGRSPLASAILDWNKGFTRKSTKRRAQLLRRYQVSRWRSFVFALQVDINACVRTHISPAQYISLQIRESPEYYESFAPFQLEIFNKVSQPMADFRSIESKYLPKREEALRTILGSDPDGQEPVSKLAILCIDEARPLLSEHDALLFRCLRQAVHDIVDYSYIDIFTILMDTTSRISNFSPSAGTDLSAKYRAAVDQSGEVLFQPIYALDTMDVWYDPGFRGLDDASSSESLRQLFALGRPLWGALMAAGESLENVISFASDKIRAKEPDLSLLSYCVHFQIISQMLNEEHVDRRLRYIMSVSEDRTQMNTCSPSEPILAHCSMQAMLYQPQIQLKTLQALYSANASALIDIGDVGEFVGILIILFSTFETQYEGSYPRLISVLTFFQSLLFAGGSDSKIPETWSKMISPSAQLLCNHFVRIYETPTVERISDMATRGAAVILPPHFPGADLLIPVRSSDPEWKPAPILVQIKNRADDVLTPGRKNSVRESLDRAASTLGMTTYYGLAMFLRRRNGGQEFAFEDCSRPTCQSPILYTCGFGTELFPNVESKQTSPRHAVYQLLDKLLNWVGGPDYENADENIAEYWRSIFQQNTMPLARVGLECDQTDEPEVTMEVDEK